MLRLPRVDRADKVAKSPPATPPLDFLNRGRRALAGALDPIGRAGAPPTPPLNLVGDFGGGGMLLAFGVACALIEAAKSGKGQVFDAAMVDGAAALMTMFHSFK